MKEFPEVPKDLLERLEKVFADRCPDLEDSEREIWVDVGSVRVTRLLRHHFDKQNETILGG